MLITPAVLGFAGLISSCNHHSWWGQLDQEGDENNMEIQEETTDPENSAGQNAHSIYQDWFLKEMTTHQLDTPHSSGSVQTSTKREKRILKLYAQGNYGW